MRIPYDDLQEAVTSTQFVKYNKYLDDEEWHQHSKSDHQLAQIAYEIHLIRRGLSGNKGELPKFDDFLVKFAGRDEEGKEVKILDGKTVTAKQLEMDFEGGNGEPGIEVGLDPLDEKWQKVTEDAKAQWAMVLGEAVETG